jgi:TM2 domain-containing membrane protein YozV
MFCSHCGTQNLETAKFCNNCGSNLIKKETNDSNDTIHIKDTEKIKLKTYTINLKNSKIAVILSIIPGLGHFYLGKIGTGIGAFISFLLIGAFWYWWVIIFKLDISLYGGYYAYWVVCAILAYKQAELMNDEEYSNAIKNIIQTMKNGNDGEVSLDDIINQAIKEGIDETIARNSVEKLKNNGSIY